jgi:hypothetical protein
MTQMEMAFVTKTKFLAVRLRLLATTTLQPPTTTALVLKKTSWECVVEAVRLTPMKTASVMTSTRVSERWTTAVCAMETTLLALVVLTILLATMMEPPLTMALVCTRTNVAFAVVQASRMVRATATATFSMSVASVAVLGLPMVLAIALEMCSTLAACAVAQVWTRMPMAFVTTLTSASVNSTSAVFAMATAALAPIHVQLRLQRALTA